MNISFQRWKTLSAFRPEIVVEMTSLLVSKWIGKNKRCTKKSLSSFKNVYALLARKITEENIRN